MVGKITSHECAWKVPFKQGKSTIQATFEEGGSEKHATITLEGKDGKITLLVELKEMPNRKIRVPIETFKKQE